MLRIRLRRVGKKKQPMYRIVVADSRAPRDGAFVESIGTYHPLNDPSRITLDGDRARHWLGQGAQPSDRVAKIFAIEGIAEISEKLKTRIALGEQRAKEAAQTKKTEAEAAPEAKAEEAPAAAASAEEAPAAEAESAQAEEAPAEAAQEEKPEASAGGEEAAPAEAAPAEEEKSEG